LLTIFILTNLICNSQNILFLKNGDRLNGKLEGLKLDSLIFKLQGTKIRISSSDVIAIYMDSKIAPSTLQNLNNSNIVKQENGKIFGVVTYYFNHNYGDKPDVGSTVFVADSAMHPEINFEDVQIYQKAIAFRNLSNLLKKPNQPLPALMQAQADKYKWEDSTVFDGIDKLSYRNIKLLQNSDKVFNSVVDGVGNFSQKVAPGTYYILIKSNNRKGSTNTELSGQIYFKKVLIKAGDEYNISHKFSL